MLLTFRSRLFNSLRVRWYRLPTKFKLVEEDDPLYPYNTYSGSKILMERVLPRSCFIFRIPVVSTGSGADNDYSEKVKRWRYVEDVHKSIVYKETLIEAVRSALGAFYKAGVYNIASEVIHLPTYVQEQFGWDGEIVAANFVGSVAGDCVGHLEGESVQIDMIGRVIIPNDIQVRDVAIAAGFECVH